MLWPLSSNRGGGRGEDHYFLAASLIYIYNWLYPFIVFILLLSICCYLSTKTQHILSSGQIGKYMQRYVFLSSYFFYIYNGLCPLFYYSPYFCLYAVLHMCRYLYNFIFSIFQCIIQTLMQENLLIYSTICSLIFIFVHILFFNTVFQ